MKLALSLLFVSSLSFAQSVPLLDYDWKTEDIAPKGLNKEDLFKTMNRTLIKVGSSICSNRAMVWLNDFKRFSNIDGSKVFLFYTPKSGGAGDTTWWYHVSPLIVENGVEYAMDAGFPSYIKGPMLVNDWLEKFSGSKVCKEIRAQDVDLIELMYKGMAFPETTRYGKYDCYYKKVPAGYWTPMSVANFERPAIDQKDVLAACKEAVTGAIGGALGAGAQRCKKYLKND